MGYQGFTNIENVTELTNKIGIKKQAAYKDDLFVHSRH